MTTRRQKATAAALVVGLSLAAGLNVARHTSGGHASTQSRVASFRSRSLVKFPIDITYRTAECPSYPGLGFACWAPSARTVYFAGRPDYSVFLHESCHAWQTDHASSPEDKLLLKRILNYKPGTVFDWRPGEVEQPRESRIPPVEAFADACEQCARGRRIQGLGYGRGLSLQRWHGLCRFIASRS